jgi:hypothetical protein
MNAYEVTLNVNDHEVIMPVEANTPAEAHEKAKERLDERIARLLTEINACGHIPLKVEPVYVEPGERRYRATCTATVTLEFTAPGDISPEDVEDQVTGDFDPGDFPTDWVDLSLIRRGSDDDDDIVDVSAQVEITGGDGYDAPGWTFKEIK